MGDRRGPAPVQKLSAEESQKILLELLNLPENSKCADCHSKGPRWASANLGLFVCIKCSGIHRSIGVHITQVRSVSLDKWTPEQLENMKQVGNGRGAEIYEATLPESFRRPGENDSYALEQFIRDKYERKLYARKGNNGANRSSQKPHRHEEEQQHHRSSNNRPANHNNHNNHSNNGHNAQTQNKTGGQLNIKIAKSEPATPVTPKHPVVKQSSLIDWDAPISNNNDNDFGEFTSFTGPSSHQHNHDIEFSGFQSASSFQSQPSPRVNTTNNSNNSFQFDTEAAFFSGVTEPINNNTNNNQQNTTTPAVKPSKESILSLYGSQPTNNVNNNINGQTPMRTVPSANYNVVLPGLGGPAVGVGMQQHGGIPAQTYGHPHGHPHGHHGHHGHQQQHVPMTGYVNPVMLNNNTQPNANYVNTGYVNPNYQRMMMGGQQPMTSINNGFSNTSSQSSFGF